MNAFILLMTIQVFNPWNVNSSVTQHSFSTVTHEFEGRDQCESMAAEIKRGIESTKIYGRSNKAVVKFRCIPKG